MVGETTLEINLSALKNNVQVLRNKINKETMLLAVVKAFAYGSDAVRIAQYLETLEVDYFAVAYISEGVQLREAGIKTPILVLHPQPVNFPLIIEYNLEPSLYSFKTLNSFAKITDSSACKDYPVHIKFNTGLNRLGFQKNQLNEVLGCINEHNSLAVKSIFSHLAASEDVNELAFTRAQIREFKTIAHHFEAAYGRPVLKHLCNTSGVINFPEGQFDMVRSGIGVYGYVNTEEEKEWFIPVVALKTIISQIHILQKGQSVGYNRAFVADRTKKIATLPLGHADGIGRQYGNGVGAVRVHGQNAPIIGNVCMDMIMIDVTEIQCEEGDEVVVFDKHTTAEVFSKAGNTISYELLTGISQRVKRVFVTD